MPASDSTSLLKWLKKSAGEEKDASGTQGPAGQKEVLSWLMTVFKFPNPVFPEVQLHFLTCAVSMIITPTPHPPPIYFPLLIKKI